MKSIRKFVAYLFLSQVLCIASYADEPGNYVSMDLEQLMNVTVTLVAKKDQPISQTPAAVTVITSEDIRRSAARSVPELLRMVPGLVVAQFNRTTWSVSARGFQGRYANKLLVMIDGRTVYNPAFQGVYWNMEDLMLQDIDRIEIVRGPGGALWGANAVNGVIAIFTKKSADTQGTLMYGSGGTAERASTGVRYGAPMGENGHLRVYAKYLNLDSTNSMSGGDAYDDSEAYRTGFRGDWKADDTELMLEGDMFYGHENDEYLVPQFSESGGRNVLFRNPSDYYGMNISALGSHKFSDVSKVNAQMFYSRVGRDDGQADAHYDTYDIAAHHQYSLSDLNEMVWGGGIRLVTDEIAGSDLAGFDPTKKSQVLYNIFLQDEHQIVPDELRLSGGIKLEHNRFSGLEALPSVRLLWSPNKSHALWTSYSRAVRTPNRISRDVQASIVAVPTPTGSFSELRLIGSEDADSEYLNAYEAGYRVLPHPKLQLDIATFIFDYSSLTTSIPGQPFFEDKFGSNHLVTPFTYGNTANAMTSGVELGLTAEPFDWWKLNLAYWYYEAHYEFDSGGADLINSRTVGGSPHNQAVFRSMLSLPSDIEVDTMLRYVDRIRTEGVPDYFELDTRVGWRPTKEVELAFIGRNLLNSDHIESGETLGTPISTRIDRSLIGQLTINLD